jgi:hypothetical protein
MSRLLDGASHGGFVAIHPGWLECQQCEGYDETLPRRARDEERPAIATSRKAELPDDRLGFDGCADEPELTLAIRLTPKPVPNTHVEVVRDRTVVLTLRGRSCDLPCYHTDPDRQRPFQR